MLHAIASAFIGVVAFVGSLFGAAYISQENLSAVLPSAAVTSPREKAPPSLHKSRL
jgi:hypothetical protein